MVKPDLFEKRLLMVSGKGGVGKSTVCAALALAASGLGKRVLLVEMDEKERISRLFGSPEVGYEGAFVYRNIYARNLLPMRVMDEFVEVQIKAKRIARQILESPIYRHFMAAAPGLKELATLGKIMLLEDEKERSGRAKYDIIIVDAPATGHGVAFLRVPFATVEAVRMGWVRKQADRVIDLVTDPARTMLNIVTLPEEMPVNETVEMCQSVEKLLGIPIGYIIINSVFPQVLRPREEALFATMKERAESNGLQRLNRAERRAAGALFECLEATMRRRELNEFYISKLKRMLRYEFIQIPFIFTKNFDITLIEHASAHLMEALLRGHKS
ncbi:MAG: chromosome partitioning protein [Candidatus Abyssobacteria bacterium SURF_17]|uniref:arsenite-transporting ATPase n=1 Tax=Candidatus Abyssobacteria bacterium SURF_17 TaxID=2093361 RepID=A0A419EWD9_9BACT|nr:MAG: chromosome partitioning protein [Candidatus Abyssubacteria bacterium SURF_17]